MAGLNVVLVAKHMDVAIGVSFIPKMVPWHCVGK